MSDKGKCKHGDFNLIEGCPQCIEERHGAFEASQHPDTILSIVKVQYYSETTGELSAREYTYYSVDRLTVGDILTVPVRDTTGKAKVSAIDVPESEIASFKDKVKTISASSLVKPDIEFIPLKHTEAELGMIDARDKIHQEISRLLSGADHLPNSTPLPESETNLTTEPETAIVLRPGEDIEAHGYYEESQRLLEYAEARVIASLEDNKMANDDLAIISKLKKAMEAKRKGYLDPLKAQSDAIRDTYNYLMTPVLEAEKVTKGKMLAYDAEQRRIRQEQEEVNRLRLEAAQKEAALNNGEISESVDLVEVLPEIKRVSTDMGTSGQRDNWKYELVDFASVPDEYKMINVGVLTPAVKSFKDKRTIPGIRIYNEPIIATRAR